MHGFKPYEIDLKPRPSWWKVRLPEIRAELKKISRGRVETILKAKGIAAVHYGEKEFPEPLNRWPAAASSSNPDSYKTSGYDPQCVMMIAGVHGAEPEGVVTVLNLIRLLETGIDLVTTDSMEQSTDLRSQKRFREAVKRERMMIYAAA